MNWLDDYDAGNNPQQDILDRAFKDLCQKVVNFEEEALKHWFELAFLAGKNEKDLTFEEWWFSFYSALQGWTEKQ